MGWALRRGILGEAEAARPKHPLQPAVTVEPTKASPKRPFANAAVDFTGFAGRLFIVQVSLGGDTNLREAMEDKVLYRGRSIPGT